LVFVEKRVGKLVNDGLDSLETRILRLNNNEAALPSTFSIHAEGKPLVVERKAKGGNHVFEFCFDSSWTLPM